MKKFLTSVFLTSMIIVSNVSMSFAEPLISDNIEYNVESIEFNEELPTIGQDDIEENFEGPTGGQMLPDEILVTATDEEQIMKMCNDDISEEKKELLMEKLDKKQTRERYYNTYLGMKQYKQQRNYWCGPATVYQTLAYINGSSPSQSTIASALGTTEDGTDGSEIPKYLNKKQDRMSYVTHTLDENDDADFDDFKHCINFDMQYDSPTVLRVRLYSSGEFGYKSIGHFLNVGGQNTGATNYLIVDPYYGYSDGPDDATYYVSDSAAYEAVQDHFAQQLYW